MIGLIAQGGFLLIPILLLSLAAVFLIVERALYYWQVREPERDLAGSVLGALPITAPAELAATLGNKISPEAQVIRAALSSAGGIARPEQRRTLDSVVVREITALERNVPYLQSIANVATLLGLLGTVLGMIVSFVNLRAAGSADLTVLSGGIAQALITTAAGLTVAIPSTLFHHLFSHHVHRTVARLNLIVSELAAKLGDGTQHE